MFIPLRVHSVYSKGKGGITIEELASWAAQKKIPGAALSDVENFYGWAKWKRASGAGGFAPLFGCEMELGGERFLFLVKSREGYGSLMEVFNRRDSAGPKEPESTEGLVTIFIPRPKAAGTDGDREGKRRGTDGNAGEDTGGESAGVSPEKLIDCLHGNGDFYVGCDFFNFGKAQAFAQSHDLPLVWANPLKFVRCPERLVLLHAFEKKIPYPPEWERLRKKIKLFGPDQEVLALKKFGAAVNGAFRGTFEVAEKCRFSFAGIVPALPSDIFPVPLREAVTARLRSLKNLGWKERQRAKRELAVIESSGFAPYLLIVHDVVEFARRHGILHNLKGSGASSFLAYLLGISHVNPVEFDLYFERFLNSGRDDPPDIDLDFDSRFRDRVLTYVLEKYGQGRTGAAFVCSLKNFRARSALYETGRVFGLPPGEARALSKRAPYFAEPDYLKRARPVRGCLEIWNLAAELTSVHSEISLHVGGVILTPAPVSRFLPLGKSAKGFCMSHYDRDAVEDLKLIKLDLLSVRGLAAVSETRAKLGLRRIPPQDAKTYSLLKQARTIGCFQVESPAMMNLLRRMKPENIFELTQALALIRPGPTESGMKETLLRSREGRGTVRDPFLEKILPETDGLLLYEEQVMQIAERVAGMPPEEGDLLRRSLKAKGGPVYSKLRTHFFKEANERGYTAGEVEKLWQTMKKFSSYSFNKAHSASYAGMAYQAVYLKAHHPVPYLAAVLNAGGGYYMLPEYIEEAKRLGIKVLGPDVNRSGHRFEVEENSIRVGLTSIKGLALKTADKIIEERKNGEYLSVEDFLARIRLTRAELFTLIKAGVFDSLESRRTRQILRYFQGLEDMEEVSDLNPKEKAKMLLDSLGFSPDADPLALFEGKRPALRIRDLKKHAGQQVELVVRVVDARGKEVNGSRKYFFLFEDETGLLEGVGERKCLTQGEPPLCCLRGEVRVDRSGLAKVLNCSFLRSF
ncbi:MAG: DNA polymerase III subunit alpha [Candidatus Aminicenantales bacterium]